MSEIKGVVYRDPDEDRQLEVQFFPDALFLSIEFSSILEDNLDAI